MSELSHGNVGRREQNFNSLLPLRKIGYNPQALAELAEQMKGEVDTVKDGPDPEENLLVSAGYTYLGQFIDHDLTFDSTPLPSQTSNRKRFPALFRNTNAIPEHGTCPKASWTIMDKPSMHRRMSTGITASQICAGSPIKSDPATTSIATALIPSQAIPSGNPGRNTGQSF